MEIHAEKISSLIHTIRDENPVITGYMLDESMDDQALVDRLHAHYAQIMQRDFPDAWSYYKGEQDSYSGFFKLTWRSFAFIRVLDLLDHEGQTFVDGNLHDETVVSQPVTLMRKLLRKEPCEATVDFVLDILHLLRQLNGIESQDIPSRNTVYEWSERHPSGLDTEVVRWRAHNKERIVGLLVQRIRKESADGKASAAYHFKKDLSDIEARKQVLTWWREDRFHLRYAIRSADEVNRYLDNSVDEETMKIMHAAEQRGIPVFATPYFLIVAAVGVEHGDAGDHAASFKARGAPAWCRDAVVKRLPSGLHEACGPEGGKQRVEVCCKVFDRRRSAVGLARCGGDRPCAQALDDGPGLDGEFRPGGKDHLAADDRLLPALLPMVLGVVSHQLPPTPSSARGP